MRLIVFFAVFMLAGCAGAKPEPEVVYVTETVTPSPTGPPTYLKVDLIQNRAGERYTLQMQAYSLDSKGQESYTGYSIRSVAVSVEAKQYPKQPDWPLCNEKMEGIRIKLFTAEGEAQMLDDKIWPGTHCGGDSTRYGVTIEGGPVLRFGAY